MAGLFDRLKNTAQGLVSVSSKNEVEREKLKLEQQKAIAKIKEAEAKEALTQSQILSNSAKDALTTAQTAEAHALAKSYLTKDLGEGQRNLAQKIDNLERINRPEYEYAGPPGPEEVIPAPLAYGEEQVVPAGMEPMPIQQPSATPTPEEFFNKEFTPSPDELDSEFERQTRDVPPVPLDVQTHRRHQIPEEGPEIPDEELLLEMPEYYDPEPPPVRPVPQITHGFEGARPPGESILPAPPVIDRDDPYSVVPPAIEHPRPDPIDPVERVDNPAKVIELMDAYDENIVDPIIKELPRVKRSIEATKLIAESNRKVFDTIRDRQIQALSKFEQMLRNPPQNRGFYSLNFGQKIGALFHLVSTNPRYGNPSAVLNKLVTQEVQRQKDEFRNQANLVKGYGTIYKQLVDIGKSKYAAESGAVAGLFKVANQAILGYQKKYPLVKQELNLAFDLKEINEKKIPNLERDMLNEWYTDVNTAQQNELNAKLKVKGIYRKDVKEDDLWFVDRKTTGISSAIQDQRWKLKTNKFRNEWGEEEQRHGDRMVELERRSLLSKRKDIRGDRKSAQNTNNLMFEENLRSNLKRNRILKEDEKEQRILIRKEQASKLQTDSQSLTQIAQMERTKKRHIQKLKENDGKYLKSVKKILNDSHIDDRDKAIKIREQDKKHLRQMNFIDHEYNYKFEKEDRKFSRWDTESLAKHKTKLYKDQRDRSNVTREYDYKDKKLDLKFDRWDTEDIARHSNVIKKHNKQEQLINERFVRDMQEIENDKELEEEDKQYLKEQRKKQHRVDLDFIDKEAAIKIEKKMIPLETARYKGEKQRDVIDARQKSDLRGVERKEELGVVKHKGDLERIKKQAVRQDQADIARQKNLLNNIYKGQERKTEADVARHKNTMRRIDQTGLRQDMSHNNQVWALGERKKLLQQEFKDAPAHRKLLLKKEIEKMDAQIGKIKKSGGVGPGSTPTDKNFDKYLQDLRKREIWDGFKSKKAFKADQRAEASKIRAEEKQKMEVEKFERDKKASSVFIEGKPYDFYDTTVARDAKKVIADTAIQVKKVKTGIQLAKRLTGRNLAKRLISYASLGNVYGDVVSDLHLFENLMRDIAAGRRIQVSGGGNMNHFELVLLHRYVAIDPANELGFKEFVKNNQGQYNAILSMITKGSYNKMKEEMKKSPEFQKLSDIEQDKIIGKRLGLTIPQIGRLRQKKTFIFK